MAIGVFTDKKHQPANIEVLETIGSRLSIWQELISFNRKKYPAQEEFKFLYGKNYGWALRFSIKKNALISLYPVKGGFTAQVNLSPEAVKKARAMKTGKNVQQIIAQAHPYPEGRWLFITVETKKDLRDLQKLLELRIGIK